MIVTIRSAKNWLMLTVFGLLTGSVHSQILAFQGGEPADNWNYASTSASAIAIGEAQLAPNKVSGTTSIVVGGNTGGGSCFAGGTGNGPNTPRTFTFNAIDISLSNEYTRTLTFNWGNRFPVCNGTGWDAGENLVFTAYHDGVAQAPVTLATGNNNAPFSIQTNQYTWNIPPCVNSFYFVVSVTTNRSDELLFLDDVTLSTPQLNASTAQPSPISGTVTVCANTTGTYSVVQVSGASYTWSGLPPTAQFTTPNGTTGSHTIDVDWGATPPGTYQLAVEASNPCGAVSPARLITITVQGTPDPLTISGPTTFCPGETIVLTSSYASDNTWSTSDLTQSINVFIAGTYTVTVQTACATLTASQTVTETIDPPVSITPSGTTDLCPGGSVTLTSAATTGNSWSTGETTPSITISAAGTYTLTVTGACGTASASEQVTMQALPVAAITPGGPVLLCAGDNVTLTASGGDTYTWSNGDAGTTTTISTPGTYTVTATNQCGSATSDPLIVTESPQPIANVTGNTTFCAGQNTVLTASGGTSYLWSTGATTASITISTPGTYTVTSTNSCGSVTSNTITVTELPLPVVQVAGNAFFCAGQSTVLTASGGTGYLWSTGAATPSVTISAAGTYTVTAANSCGTTTASVTVTELSAQAGFTSDVVTGNAPLAVSLTNTSSAGSYDWDFGDGGNAATTNPAHVFNAPGIYTVVLAVTNAQGCTADASLEITVLAEPSSLIIPNVFTPNGDGMNDLFVIGTDRIGDYHLLLYNRWGNLILETTNAQDSWDGTINGDPASEGTYFYKLEATGLDQKQYNESGFFNLVR